MPKIVFSEDGPGKKKFASENFRFNFKSIVFRWCQVLGTMKKACIYLLLVGNSGIFVLLWIIFSRKAISPNYLLDECVTHEYFEFFKTRNAEFL